MEKYDKKATWLGFEFEVVDGDRTLMIFDFIYQLLQSEAERNGRFAQDTDLSKLAELIQGLSAGMLRAGSN